MQGFRYWAPTEIIFGKDTENEAGNLCKKHGASKVFVVYGGGSVVKSGLLDRVTDSIKASGLSVMTSGGVVPNPLLSKARQMTKEAIDFGADFILAVGGGSAIDTAKGVAHGVANPNTDIWEFWNGKPVERSLPHAAIPTISAAGSETSNSAVLTDDTTDEPLKKGLGTQANVCRFAIMNPELTMTLPVYQIGAGAADIFMHTAERIFSKPMDNANHMTDEISMGLIRNIMKYGVAMVKDPSDYEAASEVMWAGSLSHVGITGLGSSNPVTKREGDWSCHQLGQALSALYNCTHGASLTAVFPAWARYVMDAGYKRFADYNRMVFGGTGSDDKALAEEGIVKTEEFFKALGMPVTVSELLGHTPDKKEIEQMAYTCSYKNTRTIGGFKVLDIEAISAIYKAAI